MSHFGRFNRYINGRRQVHLINNQIQRWYEQYKTGIYRYILSITHDPQLAEDVLQDTFVQLLVGGIRFEPGKE